MEGNNNRNLVIWVVVLIVIVLIAVWWLASGGLNGRNTAAVGELGDTASTSANLLAPASVAISDQFPGTVVFVNDVNLPAGGWVVIRKSDNGQPGTIVGAGYFDNTTKVGEVVLSRLSVEGEKYFASLYSDNGDGRFSLGGDKQLLGADGQPVQTAFSITRNLPENKG